MFAVKIDCKWGPYGNWSACTKSCGGGFQTRLRDIEQQAQNGGEKCSGESTDLRVCAEHACPGEKEKLYIIELFPNIYLHCTFSKTFLVFLYH